MPRRLNRNERLPRAFVWTLAWVLTSFGLAVFTQAKVQVAARADILKRAEDAWILTRAREVSADRGSIYSADGRMLAQSLPVYDFWVFYERVPCTPGFFMALAEASGVPEARISAPYRQGKKRVWLEPLDGDKYKAVMRVKAEWGADGVSLQEMNSRQYSMGDTAVGVVGWMHEGEARTGIERGFDRELAGLDGTATGVVGLSGQFMESGGEQNELDHGSDVVLTIDSKIQASAAAAVRTAVEKNLATSGAIVVLAPSTGEVLAMANWPTFDPSVGPRGGSELMTAYMEDLQPGSTFKVLTLAKALDMGVVDSTFKLQCTGEYVLGGTRKVRCDLHAGTRAHGEIDLDKAIAKSCNVAASKWALSIGRDPMIAFMRDLGLLSKPDLGLPGAATPQFDMNEWDKQRQLAVLGFGQSVAVPPISLAAACAMIANDGQYVAPRLVSYVGGRKIPVAQPKRIVSESAARQVRKYMESVMHTTYGTGKTLTIPGYRMAGKTGTAQKLGVNDGHVSSFVGMFPAERPQVLVLVMINDPRNGAIYGSQVAGPAFQEVAATAIARLHVPRTPAVVSKPDEEE